MQNKSFLLRTLLTAWLISCIYLFVTASTSDYLHITHFPDWPAFGKNLTRIDITGDVLRSISAPGGIILFSLACLSLGLWFLRSEAKNQTPHLGLIVTAFVLGEIIFSVVFLSLINFSRLTPTASAIVLFSGFLLGIPTLRTWASSLRRLAPPANFGHRRFLPALIGVVVFFGLFYATTTARLSYDSVAEYFSHAKIMALTGRPIILYPNDLFIVSSFHPGILFTAIIQLFGDQAARMLSWVNGAAILAGGWALGKKVGLSARARLYFLTLMLTSTAFVDLLGDGKVELISTAPIVMALGWMVDSLQNPSRRRFLLIGALLGFAIIARPYNIFLLPVFTILFYLLQVLPIWRRDGFQAAFRFTRPALWMFPTLLALGAFHLWQNALWLGSALAPLTYARTLESTDWQWQFDPSWLNILRLLYPLTVTFLNTPQSLGNISPLFVGVLPFYLLASIRTRIRLSGQLRALLVPALVTLVLWITLFFTIVEIRYVFFLWILFFLFGAQVIEAALDTLEKGYQAVLRAAPALLLVFIATRTLVISLATYSPIDANGRAHCYDFAPCTILDPLNENSTEGERIFVLNAYRYYLRPDLFACSSQVHEYAALQALASENDEEFWAELYRQGFTFVTYEKHFAESRINFGTIPSITKRPEWMKIHIISSAGDQTVYQLQAINAPFTPMKTCTQTDNGIWQVTAK